MDERMVGHDPTVQPAPEPTSADYALDGNRRLAIAVLQDAINVLREKPPSPARPRQREKVSGWVAKWERWEAERRRELRFFRDTVRASRWCEAAGLDLDSVLDRLEAEGLLYDPKDRFPVDAKGRSLVYA